MIFFCLVRVACQTVSVFYFPITEVATCSPRLPIFSHPAGHSCDQKATSIGEKASFSAPIGGLLFYRGTFYLTYLKRS